MIDYSEGLVETARDVALFRRSWRPAEPWAAMINLHGLGDHSGLYTPLAEALAGDGIAVHWVDLRGHGRSPGQRAYVERWDDYLADLDAFAGFVAERERSLPLFLLGHSLGGLVSIDYAIRSASPLAGVIAAAPPLGEVGVPPVLMSLGRFMARVWPRFSLNVGMDLTGLSRNPAVVETITQDELFHRKGTARLAAAVPEAIERVHRNIGHVRVPLLLLHGTADRMVPPDGTERLFAAVQRGAGTDVTLRLYQGAYHAIFFDPGGDAVRADMVEWMRSRAA